MKKMKTETRKKIDNYRNAEKRTRKEKNKN